MQRERKPHVGQRLCCGDKFARWEEDLTELVIERVEPEVTFKTRAYKSIKQAITTLDIYKSRDAVWLDERQLSERLGISRTPVREAIAMLEQEGFVKSMPRRGIVVLRKNLREVIEMIEAWAALESMAVRRIATRASDEEIASLRQLFKQFHDGHRPADNVSEYSTANVVFHQGLIRLGGSQTIIDLTENILLHVRGIRELTIGRDQRAEQSIRDHLAIITALEKREATLAETLSRDHTLGLVAYVEAHGEEIFG